MNSVNKTSIPDKKQLVKKTYSRPKLLKLGSINHTTKRKKLAFDLDNNFPFIGTSY